MATVALAARVWIPLTWPSTAVARYWWFHPSLLVQDCCSILLKFTNGNLFACCEVNVVFLMGFSTMELETTCDVAVMLCDSHASCWCRHVLSARLNASLSILKKCILLFTVVEVSRGIDVGNVNVLLREAYQAEHYDEFITIYPFLICRIVQRVGHVYFLCPCIFLPYVCFMCMCTLLRC